MTRQRWAALLASLAVVLVGCWGLATRQAAPRILSVSAGLTDRPLSWPGAQPGAGEPRARGLPALRTGLESLPRSLGGTEVDGQLKADAAGHLVLDRGVRNVFDYFLSLVGEEPLARVRQRIQAYVKNRLPASAAAEAVSLLDRYLSYEAERGLQGTRDATGAGRPGQGGAPRADLAWMNERMAQLQSLRQRYFSAAEHAAFFGDEQAQDRYTLAKLAVLQDAGLGPVDKAQRLRQLAEALPPAVRQSQSAGDTYQDLQALTADLKARNAAPEELREARVQLVGAEATQRLEALDRQRAQWAQRVQAYQAHKTVLQGDASLSPVQRGQALAQLRAQSFTDQERLRLDALEGDAAMP